MISMKKSYALLLLLGSLVVAGSGCASRSGSAARTIPQAGPVYTAPAAPGVLPAGTQLVIRTNETIDTDRAVPGRVFSAQLDRAVVDVRGDTIVPAGAPAELVVVSSTSGGTVRTSELQLALRSIVVNGRAYNVVSDVSEQEADREGLGANRRTAETVGGGAILGTLIGAIAGGGSGAAIGAVAGAAGGAAVQVLTKGDHVRVPAETLLTFRLDQPIRLAGFRR